jgi:hypothetical protein
MDVSNVSVEIGVSQNSHPEHNVENESKPQEELQTIVEALNDVTQVVANVDNYKKMYASIKDAFIQRIGGDSELNDFTSSDLLQYTKYAMEIIELTSVKGDEQKELVIRLLKELINESNISYEMKEEALQFIRNGSLSKMIDIVVDATKGKLNINAIQEVALDNAANCCFAFLRKK